MDSTSILVQLEVFTQETLVSEVLHTENVGSNRNGGWLEISRSGFSAMELTKIKAQFLLFTGLSIVAGFLAEQYIFQHGNQSGLQVALLRLVRKGLLLLLIVIDLILHRGCGLGAARLRAKRRNSLWRQEIITHNVT